MKYFIWTVVVVAAFTVGGVGMGFKNQLDFETITGVSWELFIGAKEKCELEFKTKCHAYGGFAPAEQVRIVE